MKNEMDNGKIVLSLRRSTVRQKVLAYLVSIHPQKSYPAEIARKTNLRRNEVCGALNGTRERYRKESSLIYLGLVEKEEYSNMCMYKSTEKGKKTWRSFTI
jgi:predicted transcriptional regulator with HTH domain